jgi:hypothetical protein
MLQPCLNICFHKFMTSFSPLDPSHGIFRGNMEQQERIFRIIQTEYYIKHFALYRSPNVSSSNSPMQEKYTYHVDSTGATITAECCVNLIRKYCEKLPKDRYTYALRFLAFVVLLVCLEFHIICNHLICWCA